MTSVRVVDVHRGVPLVADLHRVGSEPQLALCRPAVKRVGDVVAEQQETRSFRATRKDLLALADWLRCWGVTKTGMESTLVI
jgi:hypothetical protein